MKTKNTIIIQTAPETAPEYAPNNWYDLCTLSETKEDAIEELKEAQAFNPSRRFRIIERTTVITDAVIYLPEPKR
ncbi:MAG: hypothetical protein FMNOHCHN_03808 [Ignavibacteriaceae bacterium]|nr:hypothetical protein [Ignavibacteriaceae bacterium]